MAMRKIYLRCPKFLAIDIASRRQYSEFCAAWRIRHRKPRIRTRMIGKRELLANGVRNQAQIGEYLSKKGNENRRVSAKTGYKVCRTGPKEWIVPRKRENPPSPTGDFIWSD